MRAVTASALSSIPARTNDTAARAPASNRSEEERSAEVPRGLVPAPVLLESVRQRLPYERVQGVHEQGAAQQHLATRGIAGAGGERAGYQVTAIRPRRIAHQLREEVTIVAPRRKPEERAGQPGGH